MKLHFKTKTLNLELSTRATKVPRKLPSEQTGDQASSRRGGLWHRLKAVVRWCLCALLGVMAKHYLETWLWPV